MGGKVEVLFFDFTTLSFASDSEDELRKKGYGKVTGKSQQQDWLMSLRDFVNLVSEQQHTA